MSQEEDIFCVVCGRDYELPRRHMLFLGDHDFSPIPRLLPCLHTVCHSCIEEQYERDEAHLVCCPVCFHEEPIKAVDLLPLDFSTLKRVVASNSTELLAWCAKCYDPVSSVSWCETCSSAMCEFHHQDHKMSADTSRHCIATFKEYVEQGKHIQFRFPPISCPHCPMQDNSLYCNSCLHLVSPKGFIDYHKDHQVSDFEDTIPEMITAVQDAVEVSNSNHSSVGSKIMEIRNRLRMLDENETMNANAITVAFDGIRASLKVRESELLKNLSDVINYNRSKLKALMQDLISLDSKIQRVTNCGSALLQDTSASKDKIEQMYLVAAADAIEYRADYLNEQLTNMMSEVDSLRDPVCDVQFIREDIDVIEGIIQRLGSMDTGLDDDKALAIFAPANVHKESGAETEIISSEEEKAIAEDAQRLAKEFDIFFTVNMRDKIPSRSSNNRGKGPLSASSVHCIVIEARLVRRKNSALEAGQVEKNEKKSAYRGVLLGQIEVQERVNREILSSHKIKSYFETIRQHGKSVLKVSKEFVPSA
jgi:hypothetical protein